MYSLDLKRSAIKIYNILCSLRKTAFLLNVSHTSVSRWLLNINKKKYHVKRITKSSQIIELIKETISSTPFITLRQLKIKVNTYLNLDVSNELLRIAIKKQGFKYKKAYYYGQSSDLENKTNKFIFLRKQFVDQGYSFISIDETSFNRHNKHVKGYGIKGQKLFIAKKTHGIKTTSVISALYSNGNVFYSNTINSTSFIDFLSTLKIILF